MTENTQPENNHEQKPKSPPKGISSQSDIDVIMSIKTAVNKTLETMCKLKLDQKAKIKQKPFVKWMSKVRVIKPLYCAFVSVISFRHTEIKKKTYQVHGIIILYIPEDTAITLLKGLGITGKNIEPDDIKDGCGEFLNMMAGIFKSELVKKDYEELEISVPHNFGYKVDELFDYYEDYKFELLFMHEEQEFLQIDIGIDHIDKKAL